MKLEGKIFFGHTHHLIQKIHRKPNNTITNMLELFLLRQIIVLQIESVTKVLLRRERTICIRKSLNSKSRIYTHNVENLWFNMNIINLLLYLRMTLIIRNIKGIDCSTFQRVKQTIAGTVHWNSVALSVCYVTPLAFDKAVIKRV